MTASLTATRLGTQPLITPHMDARMGDNLCGPAVIRVPPWVTNALGRYYLYFADHKGDYIRLAYADDLHGPWQMHEPGALALEDSLFPAADPPEPSPALRPPWARHMKGGYLYAHIASPDVHVSHAERRIYMYFHGLLETGDQATRLAISSDGIHFTPLAPLLGPPYFRTFERAGYHFTVPWGGDLWRSPAREMPFEQGPSLIPYDPRDGIGEGFRHGETFVRDNTLFVLFTRMGDAPERLLYCAVDMRGDWMTWRAGECRELLAPEFDWEGADLPVAVSTMGAERHRVRELRDPCVFVDGAETYLFYCGAGESAIGLARLTVEAR
ncbi:MAG: hypothetical protein AAF458_23875 [Pseudomonadota bacterium]